MNAMPAVREEEFGLVALSPFEQLALLPARERAVVLKRMGPKGQRAMLTDWRCRARPDQRAPSGQWRIWLVKAGRGFGKTRAGAEWVREVAQSDPKARIALVGATLHEARSVMVEGESGLLSIGVPDQRPSWHPSRRMLIWPNGAQATIFGAAQPESLRGPQHSHVWCDEIAKWVSGEVAWSNILFGLRLGKDPRVVATTTPRNVALVKALMTQRDVVVTNGHSFANRANLPAGFIASIAADYGGTRLARQELAGELIEDHDHALWQTEVIAACRVDPDRARQTDWVRVVIGVDPPASATGDACGIICAAIDAENIITVLEDASVEKASPERWAGAVARCAER